MVRQPRTTLQNRAALAWCDVEDGRVPYAWVGPAVGHPVVVVPGLTDGLAPLTRQRLPTTRQAARRALPLRLLLVSYRQPLPEQVTTEQLAGDVAAVLAQATDRPLAVTGHSLGGMVAQHLAVRVPERVDRLVLSATMVAADDALRDVLSRWERLVAAQRWQAFSKDAVDVSFTGLARWRRRLPLLAGHQSVPASLVDRHLALSRACREHDATAVVGRICAPALVLSGERDPLARPERGRELADLLPRARFAELEGVAHGFPEQAPRRYARSTTSFLTGTP